MQLGFESHAALKDNPNNLPSKPKRQRSTPISGFLGYVCALVGRMSTPKEERKIEHL